MTQGAVGASVTITGTGFGATKGSSTVKFNGVTASTTSWSATTIVATVPTGATSGNVVVRVSSVDSNGVAFTVVPKANISSLSPTSGAAGALITVNGTNFNATQGSGTVTFSGTLATPASWSDTLITVPVPVGAPTGTGSVIVRANGVNSNGRNFTVVASPQISSLSVTSGPPGTPVTITGTNFGATKGSSTVKFNGTVATTTSWSATSVVTSVPVGAATGSVVVTVAGGPSNGVLFTVPALTAIAVSPQLSSLPVQATRQFVATGTYADSSTANLTASATWSSSTSAVATITSTGRVTALTEGQTQIQATFGGFDASTTLTVKPSRFSLTSPLLIPRRGHTASLLPNGRVLIVGGATGDGLVVMASEVYDPIAGTFSYSGGLITPREQHTATTLADGRILIVGGIRADGTFVAPAEVYDPLTGGFSAAGALSMARANHTATLLTDGRVLVVGGVPGPFGPPSLASAEIYDPATNTFALTGSLSAGRHAHEAVRLPDGSVLVLGGASSSGCPCTEPLPLTTERYDPASGTFSADAMMQVAGSITLSTTLADGRVLSLGGFTAQGVPLSRAELYNPSAPAFVSTGSLNVGRGAHAISRLGDGLVLITGGFDGADRLASAEIYDPATGTFEIGGYLQLAREAHTATVLGDGRVLIAGGSVSNTTTEIYNPFDGPPPPASLQASPTAVTLRVGDMRVVGVVDQQGRPRADVTWTIDHPELASLETIDGVARVTGVAAGSATLTAAFGSVSTQAQVTVISGTTFLPGTALWSLPVLSGEPLGQIVQATITGTGGPELYVVSTTSQSTRVKALTTDGQQLWQVAGPVANANPVPDSLGGLVLTAFNGCDNVNPMRIVDLDHNGNQRWQVISASACTVEAPQMAVRQDGSIVVASPGNTSGFPELMILDAETGAERPVPQIPQSTFTDSTGQTSLGYSRIGPPSVDANGNAYVMYELRTVAYPPVVTDAALWLLKIAPDGTYTETEVVSTTENHNLFPGRIIPDGGQGVIVTWVVSPAAGGLPTFPLKAAHVSAGGTVTTFDLELPITQLPLEPSGMPSFAELVLGDDGRAFVAYKDKIGAFDFITGTTDWVYSAPSPSKVTILRSEVDNGVTAKLVDASGVQTVVRFTSTGTVATDTWSARKLDHLAGDRWIGQTTDAAVLAMFAAPPIAVSESMWVSPTQGGAAQAKVNLRLISPNQSDPNQAIITTVLSKVRQALIDEPTVVLVPTCTMWLNGSGTINPVTMLDLMMPVDPGTGLPAPPKYGHAPIVTYPGQPMERIAAFAYGNNPDKLLPTFMPTHWMVVFNDNGAFFNQNDSRGRPWEVGIAKHPGASLFARGEIVIHELAHLVSVPRDRMSTEGALGFMPDYGNDAAQRSNATLVELFCGPLIRRLQ